MAVAVFGAAVVIGAFPSRAKAEEDDATAEGMEEGDTPRKPKNPAPETETDSGEVEAVRPQPGTDILAGPRALAGRKSGPTIPLEEPINPDLYVCGRGDTFELNFWGKQNLSQRVTVDLEGRTFLSKIGYVEVVGKSLTEARAIIRKAVHRYYPGVGFDLSLATPRSFTVHVVENVSRPGSYIATSVKRVAKLLTEAGGIKGSQRRIEIRRRGGATLVADLVLYQLTGDTKYNPFLMDGDIVRVPVEGLAATISGPVNRPGRYELVKEKNLAELLDLAGGYKSLLTRRLPILVVRRTAKDSSSVISVPLPEKGDGAPDFVLQAEDEVFIPSIDELQRSVLLVGAFAGAVSADKATPVKRVAFLEGDSVRGLLARAGGVGATADLDGAYLIRGGSSKVIRLDLEALFVRSDLSADRPVELGDVIVVPQKRHGIHVEGAVLRPGLLPFNPQFHVAEYLANAGGRTRFAQTESSLKVVSSNGETRSWSRDLQVLPGDTIIVPERTFSRSEIVQLVVTGVGILLSTTALVVTAVK